MVWLTPFTIVLIFFFYFSLSLSLSLISSQITRRRGERKNKEIKRKKITLKTHRSSDDDITGIVEKISIR